MSYAEAEKERASIVAKYRLVIDADLLEYYLASCQILFSAALGIRVTSCGNAKKERNDIHCGLLPVMTKKYKVYKVGMLISGYLDTRVPCGLPGSRETSDLPSYRLIAFIKARRSTLRGSPRTQFTVVPCMSWSGCKLPSADTVHAFIYVCRVGFVKCHK